jgi:hypothetical protein
MFEKKYEMSKEDYVFVVRKYLARYIYNSLQIEGIPLTLPDTQEILDGHTLPDGKVNDVLTVLGLKRAWEYVSDSVFSQKGKTNLVDVCNINNLVGMGGALVRDAGKLRTGSISVTNTSWKPDIPNEYEAKEKIAKISGIGNDFDRAFELGLYVMRNQLFFDGNKRTGMLAMNKVLSEKQLGVITIDGQEERRKFASLLIEYYESGKPDEIKKFLYDTGLDGIDFSNGESRR